MLTPKKFEQEARNEAAKSQCMKRKVGAIIVDAQGFIVGRGYNKHASCSCQKNLEPICCPTDVIHAEVAALQQVKNFTSAPFILYVTQPPCNNCLEKLDENLRNYTIIITEEFIKFDDDKDDYSLIPIVWLTAFAKILTFGAKKYKPNNWKRGTEDRYYSALMRHLIAWRGGEWLDKDSGMPHLWHVLTNVGFLITLGGDKNGSNNALQQRDKE